MTIQQTSYEPYQWTITAEEDDSLSDIHAFLRRLQGGMKYLECEIEEPETPKKITCFP